jgi:hypothetical protein
MIERINALHEILGQVLPTVDGVLALIDGPSGIVSPYLYSNEQSEDLKALAIWPKMPVPDTLKIIQKAHPEVKLAVVCRGCEERGIA